MSLRNVRVATRTAVSFALLALLVLLVGSFSLGQMRNLHSQGEYINTITLPSLASIPGIYQCHQHGYFDGSYAHPAIDDRA